MSQKPHGEAILIFFALYIERFLSVKTDRTSSIKIHVFFSLYSSKIPLVFHPGRNRTHGPPGAHHCVVKISSRWIHIAVEILPSTGTHQTIHEFGFCLDEALGWRGISGSFSPNFMRKSVTGQIALTTFITPRTYSFVSGMG